MRLRERGIRQDTLRLWLIFMLLKEERCKMATLACAVGMAMVGSQSGEVCGSISLLVTEASTFLIDLLCPWA